MAKQLKRGDDVSWKSHGGTAHGKVEKKVTSSTKIPGHTARATPDDPQYVVRSDQGGKAIHKPSALDKE